MGECVLCDGDDNLPNRCKFCKQVFCGEHRLPESHDCPGLDLAERQTKPMQRLQDAMGSEEARDEKKYEVVDPSSVEIGSRPDIGSVDEPEYESSPDVAPDGSIVRDADNSEPSSSTGRETISVASVVPGGGSIIYWMRKYRPKRWWLRRDRSFRRMVRRRVRWMRYRLVQLTGFGLLLLGAWDLVSELELEEQSELIALVPPQSFVDLTQFDALILIGLGAIITYFALNIRIRISFWRAGVLVIVALLLLGALGSPELLGAPGSENENEIDEAEIEGLILEHANEGRMEKGYPALDENSRAADAAREHAEDMAENDYFSHTAQDGETAEQRYGFCRGGENIAQTWANTRVETADGTTVHTSSADVAEGLHFMWMNSAGHRENILHDEWSSAGAGVAITDDGTVYAVMGFCM